MSDTENYVVSLMISFLFQVVVLSDLVKAMQVDTADMKVWDSADTKVDSADTKVDSVKASVSAMELRPSKAAITLAHMGTVSADMATDIAVNTVTTVATVML